LTCTPIPVPNAQATRWMRRCCTDAAVSTATRGSAPRRGGHAAAGAGVGRPPAGMVRPGRRPPAGLRGRALAGRARPVLSRLGPAGLAGDAARGGGGGSQGVGWLVQAHRRLVDRGGHRAALRAIGATGVDPRGRSAGARNRRAGGGPQPAQGGWRRRGGGRCRLAGAWHAPWDRPVDAMARQGTALVPTTMLAFADIPSGLPPTLRRSRYGHGWRLAGRAIPVSCGPPTRPG
jgi:hypothetical protein